MSDEEQEACPKFRVLKVQKDPGPKLEGFGFALPGVGLVLPTSHLTTTLFVVVGLTGVFPGGREEDSN